MLTIGITGPTGSGKTTALKALAGLGAAVIDCDAVYHRLTVSCKPMLDELLAAFGAEVFDSDGGLDRGALAAVVFEDPDALAGLNSITHRYVAAEVDRLLAQASDEGRPCAAVDAIALFESGLAERCGVTVVVTASDAARLRRIMARDGIGRERAAARMAAQRPSAWFEERCDYILRSNGDDAEGFYREATEFFKQLLKGE